MYSNSILTYGSERNFDIWLEWLIEHVGPDKKDWRFTVIPAAIDRSSTAASILNRLRARSAPVGGSWQDGQTKTIYKFFFKSDVDMLAFKLMFNDTLVVPHHSDMANHAF